MGTCVSRPQWCVRVRRRNSTEAGGKRWRRKRRVKNRISSLKLIDDANRSEQNGDDHRSCYSNPTFHIQGGIDEAWFDSNGAMESDCEDDYHSVQEDAFSFNGHEAASVSSRSSMKDARYEDGNSIDLKQKGVKHADNISRTSVDGVTEMEKGGVLNNYGILTNNCLPCLASTAPSNDKKGSQTSRPTHSKRKASLKLSFRCKFGEVQAPSTKYNIVTMDKMKVYALNYAAYYPFGVDVFLCPRKIDHISRFLHLPDANSSSKFPSILVVNIQCN